MSRGGVPVLRRKRRNPRRSSAAESWFTAGRLSPALSEPFLPIQTRPRSAVPAVMTMAWAEIAPRLAQITPETVGVGGHGSPPAGLGADRDCSTWNMGDGGSGGEFGRKGRKGDCGRFRLSSPPAQARATIGNRPRLRRFLTELTGLTGFGGWGVEELSHRDTEAQRVGGWGVDWTGFTGLGGWGEFWTASETDCCPRSGERRQSALARRSASFATE